MQEGAENFLEATIEVESEKWYNSLKRLIDVIIFLGERGFTFQGSSQRIGDSNNGSFLGLIKLLSNRVPIPKEHVLMVEESHTNGERLQVLYLSNESLNEFIAECFALVKQHILGERKSAKYYAIIVDSTPDSSHVVKTTFSLRYQVRLESRLEIAERSMKFVDCSEKTGSEIALMIIDHI